jgi:pilus assembly protein CpaB
MVRRLVLLILAAVIAAVGTGLVFMYAHNANQRAIADTHPEQVLVATAAIPPGITGSAASSSFVLKAIPRDAIVPGALSNSVDIADKISLQPIVAGEQILPAQWGDKTSYSQLQIPSGQMAVSVQMTDPGRVAGFVTPGSQVAVFLDAKPDELGGGTSNPSGASTGNAQTKTLPQFVRLLMPKATVLASGPTTLLPPSNANGANTDQVAKAILTLAVDQKDAQRLILAAQHGVLYFALLRDDSKVVPSGPITGSDLWPDGAL